MITAVWGRADRFDVVFSLSEAGDWRVSVPPDLSDGQYATEIWAENDAGEQGYWTGILYMVDSILVCLELRDDPYSARLLPDRYGADLTGSRYEARVLPDRDLPELLADRYTAGLSRRQCRA